MVKLRCLLNKFMVINGFFLIFLSSPLACMSVKLTMLNHADYSMSENQLHINYNLFTQFNIYKYYYL